MAETAEVELVFRHLHPPNLRKDMDIIARRLEEGWVLFAMNLDRFYFQRSAWSVKDAENRKAQRG